jgi:hypothetical protein
MLVTVTYPLADLRELFTSGLGRIDHHRLNGFQDQSEWRYLRSVGLPTNRLLGQGFSNLEEGYYFSLDRLVRPYSLAGNRPAQAIKQVRTISRLYQLDSITGRIDIGFALETERKALGFDRIRAFLNRKKLAIAKPYYKSDESILDAGDDMAGIVQSRTSKESALRERTVVPAVFAGVPIVFIEATTQELSHPSLAMQEIPLAIPDISLFHSYLPSGHRVWVIRRASQNREARRSARLLRLALNRLYTQQSVFRNLVRHLPATAEHATNELLVDVYTAHLTKSARFMKSLEYLVERQTGLNFGQAAVFANDSIALTEVDSIIAAHETIITRKNIFNNLKDSVRGDAASGSGGTRNFNFVLNLFGLVWDVNQTNQNVYLAPAKIEKPDTHNALVELAEFFAIYGSQLDDSRQVAISELLNDIGQIHRSQSEPGPATFSKVQRIAAIFSKIPFGQEKLNSILEHLSILPLAK